ncbi:glycosyltransferase family 2 protein [Microbacterium hominis]|uniref:Glycosyltransferase n=1 Tax=Microbacterium hominis TaxID=162426 RepID=A0A7D4THR3_9MICO|nr:glycosyltransferase [Microbacterium hominis]QKJ20281.1 glycosyltransferase [Microbacterium hominis]
MPRPEDVTLAICTRERPEMLSTALASFTSVTPPGVQILVVDSASTTWRTREVARDAGVDYVRTDVKGLSIARNVALEASSRPIIVYTDDDCAAVEGWLDPFLAQFDDTGVGCVTGRMLDHTLIGAGTSRPSRRFSRTIEGLDAGHGAIMGFRRERVVALGGFDPVLGAGRALAGAEDLDIFCRILDDGAAIVFDPACVVHHVHTREGGAYTELHRGYGLGLGALAAKWVRMHPRVGATMIAIVVKRTISRVWRFRSNARRRSADLAMLRGFGRGALTAMRFPLTGRVFVDEHPPEPITLNVSTSSGGDES